MKCFGRIANCKMKIANCKLGNEFRNLQFKICNLQFAIIPACAFVLGILLSAGAFAAGSPVDGSPTAADRHFHEQVKPLLASHCTSCHGPDKAEGGLRLDSREAALKGGDSGPALVPGNPDQSLLLAAVKRTHKILEMPPKQKLSGSDIAVLERWIRDGAPWPAASASSGDLAVAQNPHVGDAWSDPRNPIVQLFGGQRLDLWSLKPVKRPALPNVKQADWPKRDLDRFILARFEQEGVSPPAMAEPRTIARRLFFDLIGLPPTPEQVAAFQKSVDELGSEEAAHALVDQLLSSPRFGEHFARLWLDVVRYSDSNGFDWDEFRPQAWRYRDYVVRSFAADKPFDQFIREQVAGDELFEGAPTTPAQQDDLIATGYLRLGPHDNAAKLFNEQDRSRAELLADVTETTAGAFLGLTMTCCRCHDHKYDPLSQADHYRFRAFFAAMQFADDVPIDLAADQAAINKCNEQLEAEAKPLREKLAALPATDKPARDGLQKQIAAIESKRRAVTHALLMTDNPANVPITHVLFQGDYKSPRDAVEPGFPSIFDPQPATIAKPSNSKTTGRRLTLAKWIASPQNPLTARVFVNRIWTSLMGHPLAATPNDFGLAGSRPKIAHFSIGWPAISPNKVGRSKNSSAKSQPAPRTGRRRRSLPMISPFVRPAEKAPSSFAIRCYSSAACSRQRAMARRSGPICHTKCWTPIRHFSTTTPKKRRAGIRRPNPISIAAACFWFRNATHAPRCWSRSIFQTTPLRARAARFRRSRRKRSCCSTARSRPTRRMPSRGVSSATPERSPRNKCDEPSNSHFNEFQTMRKRQPASAY